MTNRLHSSWRPTTSTPNSSLDLRPRPAVRRGRMESAQASSLSSQGALLAVLTGLFLLMFIQHIQGHIPPLLTLYQEEKATKHIPHISVHQPLSDLLFAHPTPPPPLASILQHAGLTEGFSLFSHWLTFTCIAWHHACNFSAGRPSCQPDLDKVKPRRQMFLQLKKHPTVEISV